MPVETGISLCSGGTTLGSPFLRSTGSAGFEAATTVTSFLDRLYNTSLRAFDFRYWNATGISAPLYSLYIRACKRLQIGELSGFDIWFSKSY